MAKLKKGTTLGNVISLERHQTWIEAMTYTELLGEVRFMKSEKARVKKAKLAALKVDPRGMWCELHSIDKMFKDMINCCDGVVKMCQKEMIHRMNQEAKLKGPS